MNLKKILSLSLGLVVLATVAILSGTGTVGASPHINSVIAAPPPPSVPVTVTNPSLAITGNVGILGIPPVNVISMPPVSANITNTPTVNAVVQGTTAISGSVRVLSDSGVPVIVEPDAAAARAEVSRNCGNIAFDATGLAGCTMYTVPSGSNLVVEDVSILIQSLNPGEYIQTASVGVPQSGALVNASSWLAPVQVGSVSGFTCYTAHSMVRMYFSQGTNVGCSTQVANGTGGAIACTFVGHLVPL